MSTGGPFTTANSLDAMESNLRRRIAELPPGRNLVLGFAGLVLLSIFVAAATGYFFLAGAPALVLIGYLAAVNFRPLYWLLIACIPISTEILLPNGLGTDLPTEPLIVGLMLVFVIFLLSRWKTLPSAPFRHPLTVLLMIHLAWIATTTITSDLFVVSLKFLLAKFWYIITFFALTAYLIRSTADFR